MTNSFYFNFLSIFFILPQYSNALCSMYGVCHETAVYFNYCPADNSTTIPRALPEDSRHLEERLKLKCPYLFADGNKELCCDPAQVEALFKMISIATSLFSRCPSCMDNFWKYWCMYTCSPKQEQFLTVLEMEKSPSDNRMMVTKVRYDLSRQYAENTYESCKDVKLASSSGNAMLIMCGRLAPNETCSLEKWLTFMGTRSDSLGIPVDILHFYHDANVPGNYMHLNTSRCDQSPRVGQSRCMIADCPIGRSDQFLLEGNVNQEACKLLGLGCSIYFLVFSVVIFIGVLTWAFLPYLFQRVNKYESSTDSASTISSQAHWIPKQIQVNSFLFVEFVSKQPYLALMSGILLAIICSTGLLFIIVTSNPIDVWVAPNSRAMLEKEYFDNHFGPFFRVQQVIMYPKPGRIPPVSDEIGSVFRKSFIKEAFEVINSIFQLNATLSDGRRVSLEDICYRPMGSGYDCMVNSPTNYFKHNISLLDQEIIEETVPSFETDDDEFSYDNGDAQPERKSYLDHFMECIGNPYTTNTSFGQSCLGPYGGPTFPFLVFGGEGSNVLNSSAVIISIPLSNKADLVKMKAWEKSLIKFLKKYKNDDVQLSFMAERSIQDEIKQASESDAMTVCIALLLMILYSIFALGKYTVDGNRLLSILIHSKIIVGFCGILSIFTAITSSLGILSFYGLRIPSAAIVMNSFVTLLIGCNRIFAVIWTSRKQIYKPEFSLPTCFKTSLPGALMCTLVQSAVFLTGAFISVPAVRSFCLMSSISIVLQLFFLCVLFLPICIMDIDREKKGRPEFTCASSSKIKSQEGFKDEHPNYPSITTRLEVKILTMSITFLVLLALPWSITTIQLGLDQKLAVPRNSYIYTHFKNIEKYLNIGPPVYFIVQGDVDFSKKEWQNKFCSLGGCSDNSVGGILSQAVAASESSYITGETLNWLDNYLEWLAPESQCCKTISPTSLLSNRYCRSNDPNCTSCDSFNADGRPTESIFYKHLSQFLDDVPGPQCVKGGRAAFQDALHLDPNGHVDSSHFMTFHVPLRNSSAFIEAMTRARLIAQKMETELGENVKVFPYSVFYIFYEQFSTIRTVSAYQLIFAFTTIFLAVFLLIGFDAQLAFILTFVCCFQLICQVIFMALWHIDLNSISAVNLVLAITICVEYSLPVLLAFSSSVRKSNRLKAEEAARAVIPSCLCGLTIPMILGTVMLTFAQSPFFNIYFFRMLIITAVSGSFSGFLLLPVLLSLSSFFNKKRRKSSELSSSALREIEETKSTVQSTAPLLTTVL